ncbi:Rrf2 family transcriptional regulator, partial [Klebsiella pneumoniae]|nr:Rrf2 family transcriptional regulator [Klebsiella pneumoniae]
MPERAAAYGSRTVEGSHWTFLTSHAHVLLCVAGDPAIRVRDIAEAVGITERMALRILHDLAEAGY